MPKQKIVSQFFTNHLFQIAVISITGVIAFTWLQAEVKGMQFRIMAIEEELAEYPSQEWFELKFDTIEEKIDNNTEKLEANHL